MATIIDYLSRRPSRNFRWRLCSIFACIVIGTPICIVAIRRISDQTAENRELRRYLEYHLAPKTVIYSDDTDVMRMLQANPAYIPATDPWPYVYYNNIKQFNYHILPDDGGILFLGQLDTGGSTKLVILVLEVYIETVGSRSLKYFEFASDIMPPTLESAHSLNTISTLKLSAGINDRVTFYAGQATAAKPQSIQIRCDVGGQMHQIDVRFSANRPQYSIDSIALPYETSYQYHSFVANEN